MLSLFAGAAWLGNKDPIVLSLFAGVAWLGNKDPNDLLDGMEDWSSVEQSTKAKENFHAENYRHSF